MDQPGTSKREGQQADGNPAKKVCVHDDFVFKMAVTGLHEFKVSMAGTVKTLRKAHMAKSRYSCEDLPVAVFADRELAEEVMEIIALMTVYPSESEVISNLRMLRMMFKKLIDWEVPETYGHCKLSKSLIEYKRQFCKLKGGIGRDPNYYVNLEVKKVVGMIDSQKQRMTKVNQPEHEDINSQP